MAISHGLRSPAAERLCDGTPGAARSFGPDRRHHRHAGAEQYVGRLVEHDLHRHALHDLDEIAGGVLRRQQAEGGAAAGLDAVDLAFEYAMWIGVDAVIDRIARPHGKITQTSR